ncbi:MAG: protein translocase SEC61 complex subunit gamma [Candidatus Diapherotrites archaeon]|nr:protein translocase SEC61 complex subunit gamma [Candidatus Diapherotrites archaeon]
MNNENPNEKKNPLSMLTEFLEAASRVLTISKKPTWKEFSAMAKITGIGIIIIGILGYIVILLITVLGIGQ